MSCTGHIGEIFSSIQGEGVLVGRRQIFVRFLGCNLECSFCDTPESQQFEGDCHVQETPDRLTFRKVTNPLSVEDAVRYIVSLNPNRHHSVSLTGGEPLLQGDFLALLGARLKDEGTSVYLETNGTLPEAFKECLDVTDIVAMDWKLPSSAGQGDLTREHIQFLKLGMKRNIFVKIVITDVVELDEFKEACLRISEVNSEIPLVIQPVTSVARAQPPSPEQVLRFHTVAQTHLQEVLVIAQMHRRMGLR